MSLDQKIKAECEGFLSRFHSLLLATLDHQDEADLSYAPFVDHDGHFFILTSQLSSHTVNLKRHPTATVLFIEEESACDQIYARRRLRFQCQARQHPRDSDTWRSLIPLFSARFGDIIDTLSTLPDFQLFGLAPLRGRWIKGFGKAFHFEGRMQRNTSHLNPGKKTASD